MTDTLPAALTTRRWSVAARRELLALVRPWLRWLSVAVIVLTVGGPVAVWTLTDVTVTGRTLVTTLTELAKGGLPLVAIAVGYSAVIYARQSDGLLLSLSVPQSRRSYLFGTFLGRGTVLAIPIGGGLLLLGLVTTALWSFDLSIALRYPGFLLITLGYGLGMLAIAVVASTIARTGRRALLGAVGTYLLVGPLWSGLVSTAVQVLFRFDSSAFAPFPDWAVALQFCSPAQAYGYLVTTLYDLDPGIHYSLAGDAWVVTPWTALLVLGAWIVVPLLVGAHRFRRMDLTRE